MVLARSARRLAQPLVHTAPHLHSALGQHGLLRRGADSGAVAVRSEWIAVALVGVGMAAQVLLTIDGWVHGRASSERSLGRDVDELKRVVAEVKQKVDRGEYGQRIGEIRERLAAIDEHLENTDRTVDELKRHSRPGRGSA